MTLNVDKIVTVAELEKLVPEWDSLEAALPLRVPFQSATWNLLWWKHFRQASGYVHDELCTYALRDDQGRLIAIAPMMLTSRPNGSLALVRELQFFGADPNITELRGPICRSEDQQRVMAALQIEFNADHRAWDWVQWCGINSDGLAALDESRGFRRREPVVAFYLSLPDTWEQFRAGLSRNIKESLRKCYNSLKRNGHEYVFRLVSRQDEILPAVDRFLELHAERSKVSVSIHHSDVFASAVSRSFLREYCLSLAARNQIQIFQLEIDGKVVATRIGFVLGTNLFLYYSGYKQEWGRYSVMTTVVAEAIRWAIANGIRVVNLSTGRDVSKTRWGPLEIEYVNGLQCAPGFLSRIRFNTYQFLDRKFRQDKTIAALLRGIRRNGV